MEPTDCCLADLPDVLKASTLDYRADVPASNFTTYRLGGLFNHMLFLNSMAEVNEFVRLTQEDLKYKIGLASVFVIGNGSNVLVGDKGFNGLTIKLGGDFSKITEMELPSSPQEDDVCHIKVGAAMQLPKFARQATYAGFSGCEFYVGIPGSIGGAVVMNAGGHGKQTSDVIESCEVLNVYTGNVRTFTKEECHFGYRRSIFDDNSIILTATYRCIHKIVDTENDGLSEIVKWRRDHQPGGHNVGSVFKNPETESAGALIEECGLKGFRVGGAFVSEKHANFIQADDSATADDVLAVVKHVQKVVSEKKKIILETEFKYIVTDDFYD